MAKQDGTWVLSRLEYIPDFFPFFAYSSSGLQLERLLKREATVRELGVVDRIMKNFPPPVDPRSGAEDEECWACDYERSQEIGLWYNDISRLETSLWSGSLAPPEDEGLPCL